MPDLLLLTALLVAVGCGWWLGSQQGKRKARSGLALSKGYLGGLDIFIKEQSDESIEKFLNALDPQGNTADIHLALGRLFRTRGEVDKATHLHQGLLARSDLPRDKLLLIQFELANDYMVAGLLDRAERLLEELSRESGEVKWRSTELLMQVYQREKEWDKAIGAALVLLPRKAAEIRPVLAHYSCEKALEALAENEINLARRALKRALSYDQNSVRASLLKGRIETDAGNFKEAIKALRRVKDQDISYLPEAIPQLSHCYKQLGKQDVFMSYLTDCIAQNPSITLVITAVDILQGIAGQKQEANRLIKEQLKSRPSLRGLLRLIDMQIEASAKVGQSNEDLSELRSVTAQLIETKPVHRCTVCGYSSRSLVWLCPGCQQWGKIKHIYGQEGE